MRNVLLSVVMMGLSAAWGQSFQPHLQTHWDEAGQCFFSWRWRLGEGPHVQTAYQIRLLPALDTLPYWDSEPRLSAQTQGLPYQGPTLPPHADPSWQIRIRGADGAWTEWSPLQAIASTLVGDPDWLHQPWISYTAWDSTPVSLAHSQWVGGTGEMGDTLFFSRKLGIETDMAEGLGTGYLAADTTHWLWINDKRIGRARQGKRLYNLYIRQHLHKGENTLRIGVLARRDKPTAFLAQIDIVDEKFHAQQLVSDSTWREGDGKKAARYAFYGKGERPVFYPRPLPAKALLLQKSYLLPPDVVSARMFATGLGLYEVEANGQSLDSSHFNPGWTDYRHRIAYQNVDLTRCLQEDSLHLSVWLGSGWWRGGLGWRGQKVYSDGPLRFKAQIWLTLADGQQICWRTDSSWYAQHAPIFYQSLYGGEGFDARVELDQMPRFPVELLPVDTAVKLSPMIEPPIEVAERFAMQRMPDGIEGAQRYDAGRILSGRVQLYGKAARGTRLTLRFAEERDAQGQLLTAANRSAANADTYIFRGDGRESWAPRFSYRGFRYVDVEIEGEIDSLRLTAEALRNRLPEVGHFYCGDTLLNQIWEMVGRSIAGNTFSVPTDCPQRDERLGWLADGWLSAQAGLLRYDMRDLYRKWLQDIRDGQDSSGYVLDVHPPMVIRDEAAKPGWGDAITILPSILFRHTGDTSFMRDNYAAMRRFVEYRIREAGDSLYRYRNAQGFAGFGDWQALEETDPDFIAASFHILSLEYLAQAAFILQDQTQAIRYQQHAQKQRKLIQRYYTSAPGYWDQGSQTAQVWALTMGLGDKGQEAAALAHLVSDIIRRDTHLTTGFLGTHIILSLLSQRGHHDLARALLRQVDAPGWGYMIGQGATTLWEAWDHDQRGPLIHSAQHMAFSAPAAWIYAYIGGLRTITGGYQSFTLQPDWQAAGDTLCLQYLGPQGEIGVQWASKPDGGIFRFQIPPNSYGRFSPYDCQLRTGRLMMYRGAELVTVENLATAERGIPYELAPGKYVVIWQRE